MLYAYSTEDQSVDKNKEIVFNRNGVKTGCVVSHEINDSRVRINKSGFYKVDFFADIKLVSSGDVKLQLRNNDEEVKGALIDLPSETVSPDNVAFSAIVRVNPNCCQSVNVPAFLTVENEGDAITVFNTGITVTRLEDICSCK